MLWKFENGNYFIEKFKGIDFRDVDFSYNGKQQCPICVSEGHDNSGDNFHTYGLDDEDKPLGGKCFRCNTVIFSYDVSLEIEKENGKSENETKKSISLKDRKISKLVEKESTMSGNKAIKQELDKLKNKRLNEDEIKEVFENTGTDPKKFRGMSKEASEKFDVRYSYDANTGKVEKMFVPAYIFEAGKWVITGFKVRAPNKEFYSIGYVGSLNALMGQKNAKREKFLLFVGGEIDCITASMFLESTKKYRSGYDVVTSLTGEVSTSSAIRKNFEFVDSYKQYVLGLDKDDTGKEATDLCVEVLPKEATYIVEYRSEYKDPNDYFDKGKNRNAEDDFLQDVHWNKKILKSYGIVGSKSLLSAAIENVIRPKIPLPKFLQDLGDFFTDGIGLGEIFNIISNTSTGKSVYVNEMIADWIVTSPYKICILSMEDNIGSYGVKICSRIIGRKIHRVKGAEDRKKLIEENQEKILDYLTDENGDDAFYLIEETFSSLDDVKRAILQAIKVYQCKIIIIDPLVNLISNKPNEEQIDFMLFEEECRRVYNVLFVNVCHTRKSASGQKAASRGGDQSEEDVKGTSQITGSGTINMIIRRDKMSECPIIRNTTTVDITKNRTDGKTQQNACKIFYHEESHTLIPYSIAVENDFFKEKRVDFNLFNVTPVTTTSESELMEDVSTTGQPDFESGL